MRMQVQKRTCRQGALERALEYSMIEFLSSYFYDAVGRDKFPPPDPKKPFEPSWEVSMSKFSSSVNCKRMSIQIFRDMCGVVRSELAKDNSQDPARESMLRAMKFFFNEDRIGNCHFFPCSKWTGKDVLDWFDMIGFTPQEPTKKYDKLLSGKVIIEGNPLALFSMEDWRKLVRTYEAYAVGLKDIHPADLKKPYFCDRDMWIG